MNQDIVTSFSGQEMTLETRRKIFVTILISVGFRDALILPRQRKYGSSRRL